MGGESRLALIGNPNCGKTTLFNLLSGLRHKTSNFPGTTQEARIGACRLSTSGEAHAALIDLPGVYSLELHQTEADLCRRVLAGELAARGQEVAAPSAICVVLDATNLARGLQLAGEALRRRLPTVVAVNMIDLARKRGVRIDLDRLSEGLGCRVVACSARTHEGVDEVREALAAPSVPTRTPPGDEESLRRWSLDLYEAAVRTDPPPPGASVTDRIDRVVTHPVAGLAVFALVMTGLFYAIFSVAAYPMDWIDQVFSALGGVVNGALGEGILAELLANGVVAGVGSTVVFLPQICLLFFLISLLEDTGYLARAAFVVDRLLRPFGLSGHAFVPLLSSHACALPGIMATRAIPDARERLAAILVAPFTSCTARIPVYVLLTTLLFRDKPLVAGMAFIGCYALGACAALVSALLARRTILRGAPRPMVLELPTYKAPSVRTALLATFDRAVIFLRKAGTAILAISIVLWWLSSYPVATPPPEATAMRDRAEALRQAKELEAAEQAQAEADEMIASHAAKRTFLGGLGSVVEPVLAPLGYDRQLGVGVLASFAAREVFVTTMAVVVVGRDDAEDATVLRRLGEAKRDDGSPLFSRATSWSLLVYYVLAMQCLPTLAVTAREAGSVKWAVLQLAWMQTVAYLSAMVVYQALRAMGVA